MFSALKKLAHPAQTARNALWKYHLFRDAFRRAITEAPAWLNASARNQKVLGFGPENIFLETAAMCNFRCPMCPTGAGQVQRKLGCLSLDLVQKLADEIQHKPAQVGLWLGGEPFLNPDLEKMVALLSAKNLPTNLHTNASQLTPERSRKIQEAGLSAISFSFDAADQDHYNKMRPGADFLSLLENVRSFLRIKQERKSELPHVTVQTVVPYEGEEKHPYGIQLDTPGEIKDLFEGLPVDRFHCILAGGWSGQLQNDLVAPLHVRTGIPLVCEIPWRDFTVAWDGRVVACCGDLNAQRVLGDFSREGLYEIWNNSKFQSFRASMHDRTVEKHPLCGNCDKIYTVKPHPNDYYLRLLLLRYRLGR